MSGANELRLSSLPRNWFPRIGAAIVVLGLIAIVVSVVTRSPAPTTTPIGAAVPSATLRVGDRLPVTPTLRELIGGSTASIATLSAHHPTVINFFASFCTACAAEMKTFGSVARTEAGVAFIGVDTNEPAVGAARLLVEHADIRYPVLLDNSALVLANSFGIANLPTTFFVSAQGKITAEVLGIENASQLRAAIAKI